MSTTCNAFLHSGWQPCQRENHDGPCLQHRTHTQMSLTKDEYRQSVSNCTACHGKRAFRGQVHRIYEAPRFGLGCRDHAALMVVAPQVPRDQALHGAYMLHYVGPEYASKRTDEDILMLALIDRLGLTLEQVYATCALKCPVHFDAPIDRFGMYRCAGMHLRQEMIDVKPRIILALGNAFDAVSQINMSPVVGDPHYTVREYKNLKPFRTYRNVIEAPEIELDIIVELYNMLMEKCYA